MDKKRRAALAALLAVFLLSAGMMVRQQLLYQKLSDEQAEAEQVAGLTQGAAPSLAPSSAPPAAAPEGPEPLPEEAAPLTSVDLEALRAVNGDVAGWIAIPGTELSYPLVQGPDNRYYLSHNWKRETSSAGAVFLESTNSRDMGDFHTIAYAHQMRNDSMFGSLKYYESLDYLRQHPSVYVAAGGGIYRYDIFSAQKAGVKSILYRLDLEESHMEEEFLQWCVENSVIDTGVVPEAGERILTLSTCVGSDRAHRWVVSAVLRGVWAAA